MQNNPQIHIFYEIIIMYILYTWFCVWIGSKQCNKSWQWNPKEVLISTVSGKNAMLRFIVESGNMLNISLKVKHSNCMCDLVHVLTIMQRLNLMRYDQIQLSISIFHTAVDLGMQLIKLKAVWMGKAPHIHKVWHWSY